jgi:hypothetical protein
MPTAIGDVAAQPLQPLRARQQWVAALERGVHPGAIEAPSRFRIAKTTIATTTLT